MLPVRDKNPNLVWNCLNSITNAEDGDYFLHLIDLGSQNEKIYRDLAVKFRVGYTRLEHHEWNKPIILNYALKRTKAPWFSMLDTDYVVEEKFFKKIMSEFESGCFIQCRGYEMGEHFTDIQDLHTHFDFATAITNCGMEERLEWDYGGFQAIPTLTARDINGYDERFRLYGGMHCDMRNRLLNKGLEEKRLHGNPLLIHQTHPQWREQSAVSNIMIKKERRRHQEILKKLENGNRIKANQPCGDLWGEI